MKKLEGMEKISRRQINIRLELELYDFLVKYSRENYKTVTAVVREMIADLYKENKTPLVVKSDKE
jgi:predicted DNA-binding protein